jgi:hypothetical protein
VNARYSGADAHDATTGKLCEVLCVGCSPCLEATAHAHFCAWLSQHSVQMVVMVWQLVLCDVHDLSVGCWTVCTWCQQLSVWRRVVPAVVQCILRQQSILRLINPGSI